MAIKDIKERQTNLAAELYYIPLFFNSITLIFPLISIFPHKSTKSYLEPTVVICTLFFGWKFFCKRYFITKNNCEKIITNYSTTIKNKSAIIISIFYFILSFIIFIISAKYSQNLRGMF